VRGDHLTVDRHTLVLLVLANDAAWCERGCSQIPVRLARQRRRKPRDPATRGRPGGGIVVGPPAAGYPGGGRSGPVSRPEPEAPRHDWPRGTLLPPGPYPTPARRHRSPLPFQPLEGAHATTATGPGADHRRQYRDGAAHAAAVLLLGWEVRRVLTWIVVAALLAVILGPGRPDRAPPALRRALATLLVFLVALVALAGILTAFSRPLASEGPSSSTGSPATSSRPAPAVARSAAWSSATTSTSPCSATRHACARAPTASPPRPGRAALDLLDRGGAGHQLRADLLTVRQGPTCWPAGPPRCRNGVSNGSGGSPPTAPRRSPAP
jgi:hypothetical protein